MRQPHATDEALLLFANGTLSRSATEDLTRHLETCKSCQRRLERTQEIQAAFAQISEGGLPQLPVRRETHRLSRIGEYRFPWIPVSGILAASTIILFLLLVPGGTQTAQASDLLDRAVELGGQPAEMSRLLIEVDGAPCGVSTGRGSTILKASSACASFPSRLHNSPWGQGSPLSARTFLNWRKSLAHHRDKVTKRPSEWQIDTSTSEGPVREASLTLRAADYHPTSLDLEFDDSVHLSIEETAVTPLMASDAPPSPTPHAASSEVKPPDNPDDQLEVEAWEMLAKLNADSGWEANVLRDGDQVIVKANVSDAARKEQIEGAFSGLSGVQFDIHGQPQSAADTEFLAQRTLNGDAPALAHDWLEQQYPDPDGRSRFVNSTLALSKRLLGRAFIVTQLKQRRLALVNCTCSRDLDKLFAHEENLLALDRNSLSAALKPLLMDQSRTEPRKSGSFTYPDAKELDALLGNLLAASSSQSQLSYAQNVALIESALHATI
jgi:hypothetical protein